MDSKFWLMAPGRGEMLLKEFSCNHNHPVVFNGDFFQQAGTKVQTMKKKKNCSQNHTKDSKTSKSSVPTKKRTRTYYAPVCEASRCKFQFNIFCVDDGNWYLGKNLNSHDGHCHGRHVGHVRMNPELSSISPS